MLRDAVALLWVVGQREERRHTPPEPLSCRRLAVGVEQVGKERSRPRRVDSPVRAVLTGEQHPSLQLLDGLIDTRELLGLRNRVQQLSLHLNARSVQGVGQHADVQHRLIFRQVLVEGSDGLLQRRSPLG